MEQIKLKLLGYWKNNYKENEKYPNPNKFLSSQFWDDIYKKYYIHKDYIVTYLDGGIRLNHYRGFSTCRICSDILGSCERTDYVYIWPDKLSHYVKEHDLILPIDFIEHTLKEDWTNYTTDHQYGIDAYDKLKESQYYGG
jgi:hypothetical protein